MLQCYLKQFFFSYSFIYKYFFFPLSFFHSLPNLWFRFLTYNHYYILLYIHTHIYTYTLLSCCCWCIYIYIIHLHLSSSSFFLNLSRSLPSNFFFSFHFFLRRPPLPHSFSISTSIVSWTLINYPTHEGQEGESSTPVYIDPLLLLFFVWTCEKRIVARRVLFYVFFFCSYSFSYTPTHPPWRALWNFTSASPLPHPFCYFIY